MRRSSPRNWADLVIFQSFRSDIDEEEDIPELANEWLNAEELATRLNEQAARRGDSPHEHITDQGEQQEREPSVPTQQTENEREPSAPTRQREQLREPNAPIEPLVETHREPPPTPQPQRRSA
jgi:hypothetical protein